MDCPDFCVSRHADGAVEHVGRQVVVAARDGRSLAVWPHQWPGDEALVAVCTVGPTGEAVGDVELAAASIVELVIAIAGSRQPSDAASAL